MSDALLAESKEAYLDSDRDTPDSEHTLLAYDVKIELAHW